MGGDDNGFISTGRGGAGNIHKASDEETSSPKLVPQGSNTPQLQNEFVTTGRGGYGNMMKNNDPGLTRKVQDVDGAGADIHPVTSNKSFIGRGGYGNFVSSNDNLYTVTSNGPSESKNADSKESKEKSKKGLFHKIGDFFKK